MKSFVSVPRITTRNQSRTYITSSTLIIFAYATAFFPRVLMMLKFPSAINFLHFLVVPLVCIFVLFNAKSKDKRQIENFSELLFSLFLLFAVSLTSTYFNDVGAINLVLSYLLWAEPFLLLSAIIAIPMSLKTFRKFRLWILGFAFINVGFSLVQKFILKWDTCGGCAPGGWADGDAIKGVFINQGSGHVVSASVCATIGIYFYIAYKDLPMWQRVLVLVAGLSNIIWSQANQVVVVMSGGFALLSLLSMKDLFKAILYLVGTILFAFSFAWAIYNVPGLETFQTWIRPELYGPDGEATKLKLSGIQIAIEHFHSPINFWIGLGPGHTVDRLGGWMLRDFSDLLTPLGATHSKVGEEVWAFMGASWLGGGSSMFAPFFGWAAIWGDLGFIGLGAYLYMCWVTWTRICPDDLSKYIMLTVAIHGFIFTQMQEPGYMLFIASLIGVRWQELRQAKLKDIQSKII